MKIKNTLLSLLSIIALTLAARAETTERKVGEYSHGPDSLPQDGVPKGEFLGPIDFHSDIFRKTVRQYWLYIPAQYTGETPANLFVFHDGYRATRENGSLRIPQVLENLIHQGVLPTTIGLFISPGNRSEIYPTEEELGWSNPNNRKHEYDVLDDRYTRMLIEEIIPEVEKTYKLTDDVEGRIIGGTSSGAICAFTTAWHRPDYFRKVISMIGSYTSIAYDQNDGDLSNIPGGDLYPRFIRKSPIKPIKIFLQDGSNDIDNHHGSWFLANQRMLAAFNFANKWADRVESTGPRYEVTHVWGDGFHSDQHGGTLLPDMIRWIESEETD